MISTNLALSAKASLSTEIEAVFAHKLTSRRFTLWCCITRKRKFLLGHPPENYSFDRELLVEEMKNFPFIFNHDIDYNKHT